jgi:flagellar P-ring protein precursor FlgI
MCIRVTGRNRQFLPGPPGKAPSDGAMGLAWRLRTRPTMTPVRLLLAALAIMLSLPAGLPAWAQTRIKDIADVEGIRDNKLVGYGLVVGLNGTGDRLATAVFTRQSLIGMLERLGVNTRDQEARMDTKNVAAVMVTANLPPFSRQGTRIDVSVSALGDATNLTGGTLLVTPLLAADGEVYAVAQGAIATGAISARGSAQSITRGVPTAGRIANGAVIERENRFVFASNPVIRLSLRNPDLTTARRVAEAVNRFARAPVARSIDPSTVQVQLPGGNTDPVAFVTAIEQLRVEPDQTARVVIDEALGIIVMGSNVRVSQVAIAQGNLTIRITETPQVSQPNAFGQGETVVVPRTNIEVNENGTRRMGVLDGGVTLQTLVNAMNSLGVSPRDMIGILQAIKAAGALQAELEVM